MTTTTALLAQPTAQPTAAFAGQPVERAAQQMISTLVEEYLANDTETMHFTFRGTVVEVGLDDTYRDVVARWCDLRAIAPALV